MKLTNRLKIGIPLAMATSLLFSAAASANHSVLVEGEHDYDGDGLVGNAEDDDGDQVFGSINGGLSGVSQNGRVTVVTSGRFFEQVVVTAAGVVVIEAAPGVEATLEAFNAPGSSPGNVERQNSPGFFINSNGDFPVIIRNFGSRNWTTGFQVVGDSRVTLDNVRADSNVEFGVLVLNNASVAISNSEITGSGFRKSGTEGVVPAAPGVGIAYLNNSEGAVTHSLITHNASHGIANYTGVSQAVTMHGNTYLGNLNDTFMTSP